MNDRQNLILNMILNSSQKYDVNQLAEHFKVSQVTIRQDLNLLENKGMIKRVHGGAVPVSNDDVMKRLAVNYDIKCRIASKASSLVKDGETVMIESGSTNAIFARELGKKSDITIITNSTFISRYVRDMQNLNVIVLGGQYQHESEVLVGPLTRLCIKQFHVNKAFIGVDGFNPDAGFTSVNLMRSEIASCIAQRSDKVIILTDSSKFRKTGVTPQLKIGDVDTVITDKNIPKQSVDLLKSSNINVYLV